MSDPVPSAEDYLRVVPRCLADIKQELASEVRTWVGDAEVSQRTLSAALDVVLDARSACCVIIAPSNRLRSLKQHTRCCDGGYFTSIFHGKHISHDAFLPAFMEFADTSTSDTWPEDHPDLEARNQPKDGAIICSSTGLLEEGAVEFDDLPNSSLLWEYGARHVEALQVASLLGQAVVFIKSDSGLLHVLFGRPDSMVDARQEEPAIAIVTSMGGSHICGFVREDHEKLLIELMEDISRASSLPVEHITLMRGVEFLADMEALILEHATSDTPVALTMIRRIIAEQEAELPTKVVSGGKSEDESALLEEVFDPAVGVVLCPEHGAENPLQDCRACQKWVRDMDARAAQASMQKSALDEEVVAKNS